MLKQENRPEFDSYANKYSAGMENPLVKAFGKDAEDYLGVKVKLLLKNLTARPLKHSESNEKIRYLDFGCGIGSFIKILTENNFDGIPAGCDVSGNMLEKAKENCNFIPAPNFFKVDQRTLALPSSEYNLVIACCVFHHILPKNRPAVFEQIINSLKPGGRLAIFEHNPLNPLTRWVVSRTPVDKNAVLLNLKEVQTSMVETGFENIFKNYMMFFPPKLKFELLEKCEQALSWLPIGAQYFISGDKPE
ncbi:class I SAM-dependent methyltransferase [Bdellovibrionota bacterium]